MVRKIYQLITRISPALGSPVQEDHPNRAGNLPAVNTTTAELDPRDEYIRRVVRNKSFVDIGGLSNVIHERVSIAAKAGAKSVCLIDVEDEQCNWWKELSVKLDAENIVCEFISADILQYQPCQYDVVHSSGVIYHLPKPMEYLLQLRKITKEYCILTSTTVSRCMETESGRLELPESCVLFVPALTGQEQNIVKEWFLRAGRGDVTEREEDCGGWNNIENYYPNWFFPTVSAFKKMACCAGFEIVDERAVEPNDYSYCLLLKPR